jgi:preprotein translocase subunit SecG
VLHCAFRPKFAVRPKGEAPITAVIIAVHIIASLLLILFILLHAGRGGGLSEMFGGGMGGGLGGSTAMEKNLDRITIVTALVFTVSTVALVLRYK